MCRRPIRFSAARATSRSLVNNPITLNFTNPAACRPCKLNQLISAGYTDPFLSDADALEALQQVLANAVAEQAVADVPLGSFLPVD